MSPGEDGGVGDSLYAWQERDPDGSGWGIIAALIPGVTRAPVPLVHRDRYMVETIMAPMARAHANATGCELRFAAFYLSSSTPVE